MLLEWRFRLPFPISAQGNSAQFHQHHAIAKAVRAACVW